MSFYKAIAINGGKSNAVRLSVCPSVCLTFLVLMGWDIRIDRAVLRGAQ